MLSIDEAIENLKYDIEIDMYIKDIAPQLAEWLEELKSYRASVFSGDMTQKMLKEQYNKALDDFSEAVKELIVDLSVIRFKDIDEIAEQLKVGGENDNI